MNFAIIYYGDIIYIILMFLLSFAIIGGIIWILIKLGKKLRSDEK